MLLAITLSITLPISYRAYENKLLCGMACQVHSAEERWQSCASENIVKTNYYNNLNVEGQKQWLQVRAKGSNRKKSKRKMCEQTWKKMLLLK